MNRALILILVCFSFLEFQSPELLGQSKQKNLPCPKCRNAGKIENPYMTEKRCTLEHGALHCSELIEKDREGLGLPWILCPRCRDPEVKEAAKNAIEAERAIERVWLEERQEVGDFLKSRRPLIYLETAHFVIAWNIPKLTTAKKKVYKMHEALHYTADRLEKFYTDFQTLLGLTEKEMRNKKHYLYLFEDQKSSVKAGLEYTGLRCWGAAMQPGNPSMLVTWMDQKTAEDFHRHLIHFVAHLLNVAFYRMEWMVKEAGWADEGLSHYFEILYFEVVTEACEEEGTPEEFKVSDWEADVRKLVSDKTAPSFAEISKKSTTSLTGEEHKMAWSYVDFLLTKWPKKFRRFMIAIKEKRDTRDGLKEAFGLNFISFQRKWETYVLDNYRKKPKQFGNKVVPRKRR